MTSSLREILVHCAVLLCFCGTVVADDRNTRRADSTDSVTEMLRRNRAEVSSQIATLTASETKTEESEKRDLPHADQLLLLHSMDALYVRHQSLLDEKQQLELQVKQVEKDLKLLDRFEPDEPRPYSFLLLENLRDQADAEDDRETAIEADLKSAKQLLRSAHEELDESEKAHQQTLAKPSPNDGDHPKVPLAAELEIKHARAKISVKQTEIEIQQLRLDVCLAKQKQLAKKIKVVKKDASFTIRDRDLQFERLAGKEAALKHLRHNCELRLQQNESSTVPAASEKKEETAKEKAPENVKPKEAKDRPPAGAPSTATAKTPQRILADVGQAELVLLDQQIENFNELRRVWKRRYELAHSTPERKELKRWLADAEKFRGQIKDLTYSIEHRQNSIRDAQTVITEPNPDQANAAIATGKEVWQTRLQEFRDLAEQSLFDNKSTERMLNRFRSDLKIKIKETASFWGLGLGESLQSFADYEVTEVDDESITVGRILILILSIVAGLFLAYFISRIVGTRLLRLLGLHQGTVTAWKSIIFYAMCVIFGVISFRLLNIPLGAFAFLGGAAAIALGFGSQDIMNNFMSGIILLTEQPIRVGDVIEVDDIQGVVTHIGLRSTRVLTVSNHELILANKMILDERVTNLTLSDDFLKAFVTIQLDRSVSVKVAKRKMLELAFGHPMIIKTMRPFVLIK